MFVFFTINGEFLAIIEKTQIWKRLGFNKILSSGLEPRGALRTAY
jgi:hypothetical protein